MHSPTEDKGKNIQFKETDKGLLMVVQDDGVGFQKTESGENHEGFGYNLIGAFKQKLNADIQFINNGGARIAVLIRNYLKM